ncbi:MAG: protein-L-isoaspartate(D-aspartate) O-methyltransferase [Acidobacteriia bacterium]|nr:protein-L-isoaspartate(D-aspartate) O-methyltransferase [Terriglobia bacterium]
MRTETQPDRFTAPRESMVASQLRGRGIADERVLAAMTRVPRHQFVSDSYHDQAYEDHPIPIGEGQTISQPYIVGITLEALALQPSDIVLEVGTGSGYQTAILAELAHHVYSIERHASLAQGAHSILASLGYDNVTVVVGDGSHGLAQSAPFDAIVVSAAAPQIPPLLIEQLSEGGRMVIPVGPAHAQELLLVRKQLSNTAVRVLEGCRFVPLIGSEGYGSDW